MRQMMFFALLIAISVDCFGVAQETNSSPPDNKVAAALGDPAEEFAAIRAESQAFAAAFNKADAKAVAALWTKDGEYIDDTRRTFAGRDAIEKGYADFFSDNAGAEIRIMIDSLRLLSHNAAINVNANTDAGNDLIRPDAVDVNRGAVAGPRGGYAAGASVTGPQGNTAYRGAAVGPDGGAAAARGFQGAGGAGGVQGAAVEPGGRVAAGGAVRGPNGGAAARGVVAGPRGAAAGFARVSPSGRYSAAAAVRGNFNHWGVYGAGWYTAHPGAWRAAAWGAGAAWRWATWNSVDAWLGYDPPAPVYYDYGNTVTYQNNDVYVNGQDVGTAQQYYDHATKKDPGCPRFRGQADTTSCIHRR